ncbi:MAG TPA: putative quinol monooxygenase [Thermomicrobiales bacterium]
MYVVVAQWLAKEGQADRVAELVKEMIPHSRSEPGCRVYVANRSVEDPRRFLLYEQYDNEAAFQEHVKSAAFQEIVLGKILPLLESRQREVFQTVEP